MQTCNESPPPSPPALTNSPQSINDISNNSLLTVSPGLITTLSPTNSVIAPPNNHIGSQAPLDSIFTTGDSSDDDERSENSSEGEEQSESATEVKFSSFRKAHAKKRLNFNKNSEKIPRKSAKPKRVDPISVHSETQRMVRESKIHIPEYRPPVIRLQDVIRKLPKLTNTDAKPEIFETILAPPVPLSAQTTSTPLPKSGLFPADLEDLPDIDFISEQPFERLELTQIVEQIPKHKQSNSTNSNQPALSLPNDLTNLNLATHADFPVLSSLEAFKSRFIHHSLPPDKHQSSVPISSETTENKGTLLPPGLSQKPGGVHAFLKEKLRKSLIAKRIQEHEHLQLKLKYENEEYFPSEGSCSEAEDVERGEAVKLMDEGEGEEWHPEGGDEVSPSEDNNDSSSHESDSDSETSESEESEIDSSDTEGENDIIIPNLKAKRQVLNDSDNDDSNDVGEESAVNLDIQVSQPLILDSPPNIPSLQLVQSPTLSQSLSEQHRLENDKESDMNSSINLPFSFHNTDAQESFNLPSAFQLSTQSYIPDDLMRICDATQEGENELQLICSGRFTQATLSDELDRNNDVIANNISLQLDDTVDPDLPVLAPRKMKVKDQLRLKRYRQLAAFEEKEAELSGSDPEFEGSDCASEFGNELDEYESEEGDQDLVESEEVERLNAKYYNQVMIEDDEANMEMLKERFLPEQDIVEDGLRLKNGLFRKRKFNFEDDDISSSAACDWDEDGRDQDVDQVTQERRRRRVERENYIARKFKSSLSDLAYSDTKTIPLVDKPNIVRSVSCDQKNNRFNVPSIRKSLGKHNSLLTRNFAAKLDSNFISDSNSGGNLVGRKSYVFQTIRSLEGGDSTCSVPPLIKSVSLPPPGSSVGIKKGNHFNKNTKLQPELKKEDSFLKPGSSVFHLLNVT